MVLVRAGLVNTGSPFIRLDTLLVLLFLADLPLDNLLELKSRFDLNFGDCLLRSSLFSTSYSSLLEIVFDLHPFLVLEKFLIRRVINKKQLKIS